MKIAVAGYSTSMFSIVSVLILAVLVSVKWYLMVSVCISLMTNDVEYLLMYLLTICTSFLLLLLSV